jgi:hypothetical protein
MREMACIYREMRLGKLAHDKGCRLVYVLRELRAGMEAEVVEQMEGKLATLFEHAAARGLITKAAEEDRLRLPY